MLKIQNVSFLFSPSISGYSENMFCTFVNDVRLGIKFVVNPSVLAVKGMRAKPDWS